MWRLLEHWNCGACTAGIARRTSYGRTMYKHVHERAERNSRRTLYTIHLCRMSGVLLIGGSGSGDCSCRDR
jgi:hypothetical protein